MENSRISYQKLLVARSNEECREICEEVQPVPINEEQDGENNREVEVKGGSGKTVDLYIGRLHHKTANSSWEGCNFGGL